MIFELQKVWIIPVNPILDYVGFPKPKIHGCFNHAKDLSAIDHQRQKIIPAGTKKPAIALIFQTGLSGQVKKNNLCGQKPDFHV